MDLCGYIPGGVCSPLSRTVSPAVSELNSYFIYFINQYKYLFQIGSLPD